eukprot:GHUV01030650.1.p1 GENE.GHUV01030650.1~~GHUV01030650.1.p1  ORF type:complete len:112 (+),score=15.62 GHUV01030650.1:680-1015(+)
MVTIKQVRLWCVFWDFVCGELGTAALCNCLLGRAGLSMVHHSMGQVSGLDCPACRQLDALWHRLLCENNPQQTAPATVDIILTLQYASKQLILTSERTRRVLNCHLSTVRG